MIEAVTAYRAGLLKPQNWSRNLFAGIIVGIVALPLAIAFAIASGARPEQGLVTAILASVIVALFGGSRVQISGPTGAFVVILAGVTAQYGILGLQVATILAGIMLFFMGLVRLGNVIKFIPDPVITGFTTGIGVIIFVGALKDFFGVSIDLPLNAHFYQKLYQLMMTLPSLHWATLGLGVLSMGILLVTPKLTKYLPAPLIALVLATALQKFLEPAGVATIGSAFGAIPAGWPDFKIPNIALAQILDLVGPAFTIALLGAIESLLSAAAADTVAGAEVSTRHHANQELLGQGLANIIAPFWGGFASTGAIARTMTNVRSGGNSPIAAIVHAIVLLLILLYLAPLAAEIPLYVLAAILMVVAIRMSDWPHFIQIMRQAPRYDTWVLLATFVLTIFTDLVVAVNVGVILALLFFVRRMAQSVTVIEQPQTTLWAAHAEAGTRMPPNGLRIYAIQGPFFFGVAEKIERTLLSAAEKPKIIVFRLKDVPFMDMTGLSAFRGLIRKFSAQGTQVYLCCASTRLHEKLVDADILEHIVAGRVFASLEEVFVDLATPGGRGAS